VKFAALRLYLRSLRNNKFMTFISTLGLAIGLAAAVLIGLYIRHELSFDRFEPDVDRLVLVTNEFRFSNSQEFHTPFSSAPMAPAFKSEIPQVEDYCRINGGFSDLPVRVGDRPFIEQDMMYTDSTFFDLFGVTLAQGDPATALTAPKTLVLTKELAHKYFGDEDPIGKELVFWNAVSYTVTGVLNDLPGPTHLGRLSLVCSWTSRRTDDTAPWLNQVNYPTYIRLKEGSDLAQVQQELDACGMRHMGDMLEQIGGSWSFGVMPVKDVHLHANFDFDVFRTGSLAYVVQFAAVGLFILLIAGLNYVNLTTARSSRRGKLVGVTKTLGASRTQLIRQFLLESVATALVATAIAVLLVSLLLPWFSNLLGFELTVDYLHEPGVLIAFIGLGVLMGLLAGIYPAFALASYKPVDVLRGQLQRGQRGARLRSVLVVLQFAVSVVLIIGTLVIMRQLHFMRHKDLGYNKEHVLAIHLPNQDLMKRHEVLENEIGRLPGVLDIASADQLPNNTNNNSVYHLPGTSKDSQLLLAVQYVDHHYLEMMDIPILEGRNFDPSLATDSTQSILINEAAARLVGWDHPVGRVIEDYVSDDLKEVDKLNVIGMVKDFHFQNLHDEIRPLMIRIYRGNPPYLFFRLAPNSVNETMAQVQSVWKGFAPSLQLQYEFLDEVFDKTYKTEERMGDLFNGFTILAIFIACLGLFALAAFSAEQRTKEIGIRKVLGATEPEIIRLLVLQFLKLVAVANLIAWPVAWYTMHRWLEGFAYRIDLSVPIFILAAALSLVVALVTVSAQAIRAAWSQPVRALRYE